MTRFGGLVPRLQGDVRLAEDGLCRVADTDRIILLHILDQIASGIGSPCCTNRLANLGGQFNGRNGIPHFPAGPHHGQRSLLHICELHVRPPRQHGQVAIGPPQVGRSQLPTRTRALAAGWLSGRAAHRLPAGGLSRFARAHCQGDSMTVIIGAEPAGTAGSFKPIGLEYQSSAHYRAPHPAHIRPGTSPKTESGYGSS